MEGPPCPAPASCLPPLLPGLDQLAEAAQPWRKEPQHHRIQHLQPRRHLRKAQSQVPLTLVLLKNSSIGGRAGRDTHPLGPPACLLRNLACCLALGSVLALPGVSGHLRPHHGLTVQLQEQTTTVRPASVTCPLHLDQAPSVSCLRVLQLPCPSLSREGDGQRSRGHERLTQPEGDGATFTWI